jgi:hypothetical protein
VELDSEFLDVMLAADDADALQVQGFEEELESFFQETPEMHEALVSYVEARNRLLAKKKSRGFWPVSSQGKGSKGGRFKGKGGGKGKGSREQLLARIARSTCRACGEKGHWKAECPKHGRPGSMSGTRAEAPATVAQVEPSTALPERDEILHELPPGAEPLTEEAHVAFSETIGCRIRGGLVGLVERLKHRQTTPTKPHPFPKQTPKPVLPIRTLAGPPESPPAWRPPAWRNTASAPQEEVTSEGLACVVVTEGIEAIVDTGASRCVMGEALLPKFLQPLGI